jgi:uncharacterized protein (DUF1800 family)
VAVELLKLPEAWSPTFVKVRTPYELAIAQFRALGTRYQADENWVFGSTLGALNQLTFECPTPEGYADETPYWLDPDGLTIRLDTALLSASVYGDRFNGDPVNLGIKLFDSALTSGTRERMAYAGNEANALTILFSSPEFQRR